ncbi:MAG: hypothetical protein EOM23_06585 [Candidatus Moranbacteria bacterium]|nr:hypothetical protein [Candidatus Moranbacteria bacterium]
MQTKRKSLIESVSNTVTGFVVSLCIQLIIYPMMDIPVRFDQNLVITTVFTIASIGRGYLIRRFFNKKMKVLQSIKQIKGGKSIKPPPSIDDLKKNRY